ncbi:MAG: amidohydrolase family protein, partial [Anderseniella sp.]|nr:amidohydrolase family protein [Anderseniella sp.]
STGRVIHEAASNCGAQSAGRNAGAIAPGMNADLVALDTDHINLAGSCNDTLLDSFIFAGDSSMVRDVWAAGRHVVREGRHIARDAITATYRKTTARLMDIL